MTRAFVGLCTLLVALVALGPAAHAQRRGRRDAAREEALELFRQSETEYRAGRFAQAAALLERAWERHEEPVLLFNLGRAWEGAGEADKALAAYRHYLEVAPRADDRTTVEAKIAELQRLAREHAEAERRQAEEDARARREAEAEERNAEERDRREQERRERGEQDDGGGGSGPGLAPWILIGAGGVALGAGGLFGVMANARHDDAVSDPRQRSARDKQDGAETFATLANVAFVAGAVMAAGGATWVILGRRSSDDDAEADDGGDEGSEGSEDSEDSQEDDDWQARGAPRLRLSLAPGAILLDGRF